MVVGLPGYLHEWLINNDFYGKVVGKYTPIGPMDPSFRSLKKNTASELEILLIHFLLRSSR